MELLVKEESLPTLADTGHITVTKDAVSIPLEVFKLMFVNYARERNTVDPMWVHMKSFCAVGRTSANNICRAIGLNPDNMI